MLTSTTQLQNRSFHVVERTRKSAKFPKMKTARAKRAKLVFHFQICKCVTFLLPSSSLRGAYAKTTATATTTPENNDLIGSMGKNIRAARAART